MKALAVVFACLVFGVCAKHKHYSSASSSSEEDPDVMVIPTHYGVSDQQIEKIVEALKFAYQSTSFVAQFKLLVDEIMDKDGFVDVWNVSEAPNNPIMGARYMLDLIIADDKYVRVRGPGAPRPSKRIH